MKFLFFTLEYPPFNGGIANYYYNLVKYAPKEHEVFVLNNNDNKLIGTRPIRWLKSFKALRQEILKNQKSKLHIIVGHILPLGTVTYLLSFFYNFEYSVVLHGMDIEYAQRKMRKAILARNILKKANTIVCNSHYVACITEKFLGEDYKDKIKIVNPGVDRTLTFNTGIKKSNKLILFTLGRLVKRKGVDMVIRAMPTIVEEVPYLEYYIAGIGPDEAYLKKEKNKLPSNVRKKIYFLGEVTTVEKWQYLRKCDIFIMPNRNINGDSEGFGIVFLEANLAGKPVIGGKSGGTADAILHEETGLLVDPKSINEIADAVILLARNLVQKIEMGDEGMKRVLSCFRWEDKAREFYKKIS